MRYNIRYQQNPCFEDIKILSDGIFEHAKIKRGLSPVEFFAFFIDDALGKIVAGCNGEFFYGCLYVNQLWVTESLRHQGFGTRLMQSTENLAKEKNCRFITLGTMDFEALDFYKNLGFYVEFERHGFEKESIYYFLRKNLS